MSIHPLSRRAVEPALAEVPWVRLAGVRLGLVLWGGLAVVDLGSTAGASSYAKSAALTVLVALASVGARAVTALCAAEVGWLVANGFIVHSLGVLRYNGPADAVRLALLVAVAVAASRVHR